MHIMDIIFYGEGGGVQLNYATKKNLLNFEYLRNWFTKSWWWWICIIHKLFPTNTLQTHAWVKHNEYINFRSENYLKE